MFDLWFFLGAILGICIGLFIYHRYIKLLTVEAQIRVINSTRNWLSGQAMDQRQLFVKLIEIKWAILGGITPKALSILNKIIDEMKDADDTLLDPFYAVPGEK